MHSPRAGAGIPVAVFDQQALHRLLGSQRHAATVTAQRHLPNGSVMAIFDCQALQALQVRTVPTAPGALPPAPPSVLVVDDDAAIRTLVQSVLVDEGYAVLVASDGEQALALVQAQQPTVVLLDMHMPVMDGPAFCDALAQQPGETHPAVVVMTASTQAHRFRAQCQAVAVLGKPFAVDDLCAVIRRHAA